MQNAFNKISKNFLVRLDDRNVPDPSVVIEIKL